MSGDEFADRYPHLAHTGCVADSPRDPDYNCFGFAAGDLRWWEPWVVPPSPEQNIYWPQEVGVAGSLADYEAAFATRGFTRCEGGSLELGYVKIAIYADEKGPLHAARQRRDGRWHSKLGDDEDTIHGSLECFGMDYGGVVRFMVRPTLPDDS